jgi:hypothetical protein
MPMQECADVSRLAASGAELWYFSGEIHQDLQDDEPALGASCVFLCIRSDLVSIEADRFPVPINCAENKSYFKLHCLINKCNLFHERIPITYNLGQQCIRP